MVVDAHVDAACIFRDGIAEQLDARHVHGYRVAGRELPVYKPMSI